MLEADGSTIIGFSDETDSNGVYGIIAPPVDYKVEAQRGLAGDFHAQEYFNDKPGFDLADVVTIPGPGQTVANIDFALAVGGAIAGRVTDDVTGAAITGYTVCAEQVDANGDRITGNCADSDSNGNYLIAGLPLGDYRVRACCPPAGNLHVPEYYQDRLAFRGADFVTLATPGGTLENIDFALAQGGIITGRVTDELTGLPIEGFRVLARMLDADGRSSVQFSDDTDSNGVYRIIAPLVDFKAEAERGPAGNFHAREFFNDRLSFNLADVVTLPGAGQTVSNIDFALALGGEITGNPVPDYRVRARLLDAQGIAVDSFFAASTNGNGDYVVRNLPLGDYKLEAASAPPEDFHAGEFFDNVPSLV
jgi:hypothetical protein